MPNVTISLTDAQIAAIPDGENTVAWVQKKVRALLDRQVYIDVENDFNSFTATRKAAIVAAEKAR